MIIALSIMYSCIFIGLLYFVFVFGKADYRRVSYDESATITGSDDSSSDSAQPTPSTTSSSSQTTSSSFGWGSGLITIVLIGALVIGGLWLLKGSKPNPTITAHDREMSSMGWHKTPTVLYDAADKIGGNIKVVGIYFPKTLSTESSIIFYRFRWKMSFKGKEGQFVPDHTSLGGEESTIKINSVHCALLAPTDGQPLPSAVWWRPL